VKGDRRKLQLESLLLRATQERLARGLSDPRIRGLVTATRLELTQDLKRAKIYVSVLPQEHAELTVHGLRAARGRLRRDIADKVHIREMPTIDFVYDEGMRSQAEVMALLAKDRMERGEPDADADRDARSDQSADPGEPRPNDAEAPK
jgi:ribosome-binding factor A|tara:strand:- start:26092 stop:26535 length:444 start_codon:yes stop_codon:yes gene_type:complete